MPARHWLPRTETVRLKAEGTLDRFGEKNVGKVRFTLVSARPCPRCTALDGSVHVVTEASGIIPVHTMCRCVWSEV